METSMVISLDAMGGDHAPRVVVEAYCVQRGCSIPIRFILFGDREKIARYTDSEMKDYVEVRHTDELSVLTTNLRRRCVAARTPV